MKIANCRFPIADYRLPIGRYETLAYYAKPLEEIGYEGFQDLLVAFPLYRGKSKDEIEEEQVVGEFKVSG